jgi:hypothetical protein
VTTVANHFESFRPIRQDYTHTRCMTNVLTGLQLTIRCWSARSVLATMISVQTRHVIARGRLYVNSLFADVSSPFLPTYWLGNYRTVKYDYEVSMRACSHDRVPPLTSTVFPRSIIFPDFSAITIKQVQSLSTGIPAITQKRAGRKSRPAHQRIDANSVPASASASPPLSRGTSLPVAILAVNRTIG